MRACLTNGRLDNIRYLTVWMGIRANVDLVSTRGLHEHVYTSKLSNIDFVQTKVIKFCLLSPLQDGALIHYKQTTFLLEHQCEITLETLTSVCSFLECGFGTSALPFNPYRCFEAECWAKLAGYRSFKAISEDLHRLRSAPRSRRSRWQRLAWNWLGVTGHNFGRALSSQIWEIEKTVRLYSWKKTRKHFSVNFICKYTEIR